VVFYLTVWGSAYRSDLVYDDKADAEASVRLDKKARYTSGSLEGDMTIGQRLWFGKAIRGSKIAELIALPGVFMGKLSNGKPFIVRSSDRFTVR
jgi:hypothetical protein